ncbi:MAG: G/U mismatch-specific DNA glycosylase [Anaerolineaceae bacterium]|nr:G/U mismatch-specific DNA glycosylase [Anaerolineaceae bacterium]
MEQRRPTSSEIAAAVTRTTPDILAPGLKILFCGINPGLYSAAIGHNFGRPGNRFWPTLYAAGITPHLFSPDEEHKLLDLGCGITNIVSRATTAADELSRDELIAGGKVLLKKVQHLQPRVLAVVGAGAYRTAFERPRAQVGRQPENLAGSVVWVLPNPSGLNAHYQIDRLAALFHEMSAFAYSIS